MKAIIGLVLAFALGFACRAFGIPSPAPPVVVGALLVMAMTTGYVLVDRYAAARPGRGTRRIAAALAASLPPRCTARGKPRAARSFPRDRGRDASLRGPAANLTWPGPFRRPMPAAWRGGAACSAPALPWASLCSAMRRLSPRRVEQAARLARCRGRGGALRPARTPLRSRRNDRDGADRLCPGAPGRLRWLGALWLVASCWP